MNSNQIDIAKYVSQLEQGQFDINKLANVAVCLAIEISNGLKGEEKINYEDPNMQSAPLLRAVLDSRNKTLIIDNELWMWAIAVLAASWTGYVFSAKGSNPNYIQNKPLASANSNLAFPYIKNLIEDAFKAGEKKGRNPPYRPEAGLEYIQLRSDR
jgi:hypothetical protein